MQVRRLYSKWWFSSSGFISTQASRVTGVSLHSSSQHEMCVEGRFPEPRLGTDTYIIFILMANRGHASAVLGKRCSHVLRKKRE
jgi:hypothetical protein